MTWSPPTYVEVKMDAEFSAYADDLAPELDLAQPPEQPDGEAQ